MARGENDPLLGPYLDAADEPEREAALAEIVGVRAVAISKGVMARFRRPEATGLEDVEDIVGTVQLRLLHRLRTLLLFEGEAVRQFEDYVVTLTYNAIYDSFRRRFPERARLKNRLRYLLTHDRRFALWMAQAGAACGFARNRDHVTVTLAAAPQVAGKDHPARALEQLFEAAGGPLLLDDVVSILAAAWEIRKTHLEAVPAPPPEQGPRAEGIETARLLWREIAELPPRQRAALLLNSRDADGESGLVPFLSLGIASLDELAGAVGFTPEELQRRWDELPLDDLGIAALLGATRQQVINFRKSARERLTRRMRKAQ